MIFAKGTQVRLKHTGEEGAITAALGDGMFKIKLLSGFEIPVHRDDLENLAIFVKKPNLPKKKDLAAPVPTEPRTQYTILKSQGIQAAFEPIYDSSGMVTQFLVHLINDTRTDFSFDFELSFYDNPPVKKEDLLKATSTMQLGRMYYDQLNDAPEIDIVGREISTAGAGKELHKKLKIKAKVFFSKVVTAPLINRPVHLFLLFSEADLKKGATSEKNQSLNLKTYAKKNAPRKIKNKPASSFFDISSPSEFAHFEIELDLHIEKLTNNFKNMNNGEILRRQMFSCENHISKAIQLGVERIFIIHGIGKGKLKGAIAESLSKNKQVKSFKNEFHPKYGWGATEVIF